MNTYIFKKSFVFFALSIATQAFAQVASINISAPADGEKLKASATNKIIFEAIPGPRGDHVHLVVDQKAPIMLYQLKGSYTFEKLETGTRNICIQLVDKNHTPVGVEKCIKVKVE